MLALVSTTPLRVALLLPLLPFAWSAPPQPAKKLATTSTTERAKVRRIELLLCLDSVKLPESWPKVSRALWAL
jgi:hypothetical protein